MGLTAAEQARLAELEGHASPGLTPEEAVRLQQLESMDPGIPTHKPLDMLGDAVTRGLDYTSGLVRTGAAANPITRSLSILAGKGDYLQPQDVVDALKGKAPTMGVYAERAGIPAGPKLSDTGYVTPGAWNDVSTRGAVSGALDMALSPALLGKAPAAITEFQTAAALRKAAADSARAAQLAKAEPLLKKLGGWLTEARDNLKQGTLLGESAAKRGEQYYRSSPALKVADQAVAGSPGKVPVSSLMLAAGARGNADTLAAQARAIQEKLGAKIGALEGRPEVAGNLIDARAALSDALDHVRDMASSDTLPVARVGKRLESEFERVAAKPEWDFGDAVTFKRENQNLANKMGQYGVDPKSSLEGPARAKAASGVMHALENQLDLSPGLGTGGELYGLNRDYGSLAEGIPAIEKNAEQAGRRSWRPSPGEIPLGFGGYALRGNNTLEGLLTGLGIMYGSRAFTGNAGRTYLGLGLNKLGKSGVVDPIVRKSLLDHEQGPSPWRLRDDDKK